MKKNVDAFGQRMIELMPQLIRGFARQESNYLSRGQITLPQLWVLEFLSRRGECQMNELASFLRVTRPAATGLIDRLMAQQLVRRESDSQDRRLVKVSISSKGQHILARIWEQKRRVLTRVFGQISAEAREQYLATLEQVAAILEKDQLSHLS